jgi:hypothetical protein
MPTRTLAIEPNVRMLVKALTGPLLALGGAAMGGEGVRAPAAGAKCGLWQGTVELPPREAAPLAPSRRGWASGELVPVRPFPVDGSGEMFSASH